MFRDIPKSSLASHTMGTSMSSKSTPPDMSARCRRPLQRGFGRMPFLRSKNLKAKIHIFPHVFSKKR